MTILPVICGFRGSWALMINFTAFKYLSIYNYL